MQVQKIRSKKEFYDLWNRQLLGNKLRSWSVQEFYQSGYDGEFGMRLAGAGGGGFFLIPEDRNLKRAVKVFEAKGFKESDIVVCESAPDWDVTLQGEFYHSSEGWYLLGLEGHPGLRMREALKLASVYRGVMALNLLKKHLTAASYDDIMELIDIYPDSIIELSAYARNVGWATGRNTLIWEVRNY